MSATTSNGDGAQFLKTKGRMKPDTVRTVRLDTEKRQSVLHVLGTCLKASLNRSAPPSSKFFSVKCTSNVEYNINPPPTETNHLSPLPLNDDEVLLIKMKNASSHENEDKLSVRYYGEKKKKLGTAILHLTGLEISLDVDADRDGEVERDNPKKDSWKWGPDGHGAILLVNCDCERSYGQQLDHKDDTISQKSDRKDMSLMILRTKGPAKLPAGYKLRMHVSESDAKCVKVFRTGSSSESLSGTRFLNLFVQSYPLILSDDVLTNEVPYLGGDSELKFYVEGFRFPDNDFNGLVTINLSLLDIIAEGLPATPIFTDTVVFRVAPWIMTPNTLQPIEVFVCSIKENQKFVTELGALAEKSDCKFKVVPEYKNRGDRWMQDELEFGFITSPHQSFPVVLDSPRDRGLDAFPFTELLGPDFGYVTRTPNKKEVTSLDSFGNLEVSPPVTVNGKHYPFGRILIGVAFPTDARGRNMTQVVQDFLWAQKVQEPVALYSDWLCVGHVDEFMTFVPAPDRKGFRLLLASPDAGYKLFRDLKENGYGHLKMFEDFDEEEQLTVDEILENKNLQDQNKYVQGCIDWNRDVLKRELGLEDADIIDLPILFKLVMVEHQIKAVALYPDMVNMIVLGKNLGIPKPFGPKVDGRCAIEAETCSLLEGLGLNCTFIDDFEAYHKVLGEVHCGSNVRRKPFDFKWWNMEI